LQGGKERKPTTHKKLGRYHCSRRKRRDVPVHPKYKNPIMGNTTKMINPNTNNDQLSSAKEACIYIEGQRGLNLSSPLYIPKVGRI
jgi:hypothetical protein